MPSKMKKLENYIATLAFLVSTSIWLLFFYFVSYLVQKYLFQDASIIKVFFGIQIVFIIFWVIKFIPSTIYYHILGKKLAIDLKIAAFEKLKLPQRLYRDDDYQSYLDKLLGHEEGQSHLDSYAEGDASYSKYLDKKELVRLKRIAIELTAFKFANEQRGMIHLIESMRETAITNEAFERYAPPEKSLINKSKFDWDDED
jgi:hypothetical protein